MNAPARLPSSPDPALEACDLPLRLNLGSGPHVANGWVSLDASWNAWLARRPFVRSLLNRLNLIPQHHNDVGWPTRGILVHDVRRGLPYRSGTVSSVFSAHFLEHLTPEEGRDLLAECHRVLVPGGQIRIIVPSLTKMCREYLENARRESPGMDGAGAADGADAAARFLSSLNLVGTKDWHPAVEESFLGRLIRRTSLAGHRTLYDTPSLMAVLKAAGFGHVTECQPGESGIPGVERVERPEHFVRSLCIEACRP